MSGNEPGTRGDSLTAINDYLEAPGRFKDDQKWRVRVEYRCKRADFLGAAVKMPDGYVLYIVRRESTWQGDQPTDMVGPIPAVDNDNCEFEIAIGGCKCQSVRTRRLDEIWADIEESRTHQGRSIMPSHDPEHIRHMAAESAAARRAAKLAGLVTTIRFKGK